MFDQQMEKYGFVPFNHLKPVPFEVTFEDVFDKRGKRIPNHGAVTRSDTGDTLALHSASYALVPYQHNFDAFERAIKESALKWETMQVATDYDNNGARCYRQYLFPDHQVKIDSRHHGERTVALRMFMFDSYDGSSRFIGRAGGFDFVCCNGSISGKTIDAIAMKHTGNMAERVDDAARQLTRSAEQFIENMRRMDHWARIDLRTIEFAELIGDLPQSNPRLVDALTAEFAKFDGKTLWDAHNLLTRWGTHGIPVRTQADRQKRIASLVEGELWLGLERAA